jgi:hypothetical protein
MYLEYTVTPPMVPLKELFAFCAVEPNDINLDSVVGLGKVIVWIVTPSTFKSSVVP